MKYTERHSRRGTMLVVVLGLLVALFVIGTSFSFITLTERRAAANSIERQRALDLALDGVEYSIARLRAEATVNHYEGIGASVAGLDPKSNDYDPKRYTLHPIDSNDPSISWPRSKSISSPTTSADGNWIDFNGDNNRGGTENTFGSELASSGMLDQITGFHADGISINQLRNPRVNRAGDTNYGPSGSYMELGDSFLVRAVDAASLLNLNNFKGEGLERTLRILGDAVDSWLNNGKPTGKDNPFPPAVVTEFMRYADDAGFIFNTKDELRPIWNVVDDGDRLYEMAMNFVTIQSWRDEHYRDWVEANNKIDEDKFANPHGLTDLEFNREGFSHGDQNGRDGWPDWQPTSASGFQKAPININTATKPVLICLFAGIEAKSRLLFYQKQNLITESDKLIRDKTGLDVPSQNSGTTDIGRQNNKADKAGTGIVGEINWHPSGAQHNRAIFQLVKIGPIETIYGRSGATSASAGSGVDHASALADEVIRLRSMHPFTSWQDFDTRFLRGSLLLLNDGARENVRVPDLIGVARSDTLERNPQSVEGSFTGVRRLLPDPANCDHRANPIKTSDSAMQASDFRAWYWKSCVDMLRAALCPANLSSRYNVDYPLHTNVDRMDLTYTTAPICFDSRGRYELVSIGQILEPLPQGSGGRVTATTSSGQHRLLARRKVRTTVEVYSILRHTTQRQFDTPLTEDMINPQSTSSAPTKVESLTSLVKKDTKTGPFSTDQMYQGIWENNTGAEAKFLAELDDGKNIGYKAPDQNDPKPNRDRVGGHNKYEFSSNDFGWVNMKPRDETPFRELQEATYPLAFHARFNESLRARSRSIAFPNLRIEGNSSDQPGLAQNWGHLPWETGAIFDDFISTATPRHTNSALATGIGGGANKDEFKNSAEGAEATRYANLMPDGVRMTAGNIRQGAQSMLKGTYGIRGWSRPVRLKVLRYPCGAGMPNNPFEPIRPRVGASVAAMMDGVDDSRQEGYHPKNSGQNPTLGKQRLIGTSPPYRGSDRHNRDAQHHRQHLSNMPYYQGTVDFWIKWDLPPQGSDTNNKVVALGEVDPSSHNFSGLFGATAFGRFHQSAQYIDPTAQSRNDQADFEGVQFFVYKEPGGWLRFTRLYFMEAFGANVVFGTTGSTTQNVTRFGSQRRIFDVTEPWGHYTGTNDICNDRGFGNNDLGFLYARTDAWLDMSEATYTNAGLGRIILRPHDWHRFTLSYNSNTDQPFHLWLDGRKVQPVVFIANLDVNDETSPRNDGRHAPLTDQPVGEDTGQTGGVAEIFVHRRSTKLLEINPEDRLTVGCIFRRQLNIDNPNTYQTYFANADDQGDLVSPARPVFRFDSNFVAVANATIDDFRISQEILPINTLIQPNQFAPFSRYTPAGASTDCYFEHGFLPVFGEDDDLYAQPVRLGTMSWIELRPDWDPYANRGLTLATSSQIEMEWCIIEDITTLKDTRGGGKYDFNSGAMRGGSGLREGTVVSGDDYWASGGTSLRGAVIPSGTTVGMLMYRAHFRVSSKITVSNVTPFLLDVQVTALTPPRKLTFVIEY